MKWLLVLVLLGLFLCAPAQAHLYRHTPISAVTARKLAREEARWEVRDGWAKQARVFNCRHVRPWRVRCIVREYAIHDMLVEGCPKSPDARYTRADFYLIATRDRFGGLTAYVRDEPLPSCPVI